MNRSAEIQGLRALAVSLVLLFHAGWLPGGYIGVDVFYVISGFLITQLILREERFNFANFYSRRAKRLLPASFFVLFITAILFYFFAPVISRAEFSRDLLASTWYMSNYLFAHWQNDYQNLGATPSPLIHFWSLAVEEQFYLFWPLILTLGRRRLRTTIALVTLLSFIFSIFLVQRSPIFAFYSLPTRAFELGIGALVSFISIRLRIFWPGIISILIGSIIFNNHTVFPALPALLPTLGAAAALVSLNGSRIFSSKTMQRIGDWSYSIYLWHWPFLIIPTLYLQRELMWYEKVITLLMTVGISALTYKYIEDPIRHAKVRNRVVLVGALTAGALLTSMSFALNATAGSKLDLNTVRQQPVIYKDGCELDKQATSPKLECLYGDKLANRSIVLFGDSHAAQWFPAINSWAEKHSYKLYVMTKSSCPAINIPLQDNGAFKASICREFRKNAISAIKILKPVLVIAGNFEHYSGIGTSQYASSIDFPFKTLLIRDTPWPNRDIPTCLTTRNSCATELPVNIPYKLNQNTELFDPIPYLCSSDCPAKVDGIVAYRDQTHITVAMARHLYSKLSEKIDSLVAG